MIWVKPDGVIPLERSPHYKYKFYNIAGVPNREFAACRGYWSWIGEYHYFPRVYVHKDTEYELDATTARFAVMYRSYDSGEDAFWMNLGESYRMQDLCTIEQDIAEDFIKQLNYKYKLEEKIDRDKCLIYTDPESGATSGLCIQINVKGYDNLLWSGGVYKKDDAYYIRLDHPEYTTARHYELFCNDALSELIDEMVNEYNLTL